MVDDGALPFDPFNKLVETELAKPRPSAQPTDSAPAGTPADAKKPAPRSPTTKGN